MGCDSSRGLGGAVPRGAFPVGTPDSGRLSLTLLSFLQDHDPFGPRYQARVYMYYICIYNLNMQTYIYIYNLNMCISTFIELYCVHTNTCIFVGVIPYVLLLRSALIL